VGYFRTPDDIFDLPISANAKLVLLNLCRRADGTGESFPSRKKIASDCSIRSKRTVDRCINELESIGMIIKYKKTGTSNTYQLCGEYLTIPKRRKFKDRPEQDLRRGGAGFAQVPVQDLHPKEYTDKEYTIKEGNDIENCSKDITTEEEMLSLTKEEIEESMRKWKSMDGTARKFIDSQVEQFIPFGSVIQMTGEQDEKRNRLRALVIRNQNGLIQEVTN